MQNIKHPLIERGLFPETVPPCFTSADCKRAFRGLGKLLKDRRFHKKRNAEPIIYNGTKHDGSRRFYSTPHPIPYSDICDFIGAHWKRLTREFKKSEYSISTPTPATDDMRAISVTPLSEVSNVVSKKIRYAPFVLRADVAQFYPSIYTHVIGWAAHGKENCKIDRAPESRANNFNALDFFVQNSQGGQTRGVFIGPDAYRVIAEFIAAKVDQEFSERAGDLIVGGARHVDDYYVGVRSEADAAAVLSHLRDALREYELHINDLKTKIVPSTDPLDDPWAATLRMRSNQLVFPAQEEPTVSFINEAIKLARDVGSQSPVKLAVRRLDRHSLYRDPSFRFIESHLQRIVHHFPHVIDYVCLLVAKRTAIGQEIDRPGWTEVINAGLVRHLVLGHHHEACWLFWLGVLCDLTLDRTVLEDIPRQANLHLTAMLVQAFLDGKVARRPKVRFGNKLSSDDRYWLLNLVGRCGEFTKAPSGGAYVEEFEHFAKRKLKLLDFQEHLSRVSQATVRAISNVRFGYEDEDEEDDVIDLGDFDDAI